MRVLNESDIRPGESMDVFFYMFEHDRSEWQDIVKKYITYTDPKNNTIKLNNCNSYIDATLESFAPDFRGKYNLGDYVTTKRGGKYRIVGLPYLDYRWTKHWYNDPNDIEYSMNVNFSRIEQFGLNYTLAGVDDNGKLSGTELYLYFESSDEYGIDLLLHDCEEDCLTLLKNLSQEEKDLIDSKASEVFELEQ